MSEGIKRAVRISDNLWHDKGTGTFVILQKITMDINALLSSFDCSENDDIAYHIRALLCYLPLTLQSLTSKCVLIFEPQIDGSVAITFDTYPSSSALENVTFPHHFPYLNRYIQLNSDTTTATHFID